MLVCQVQSPFNRVLVTVLQLALLFAREACYLNNTSTRFGMLTDWSKGRLAAILEAEPRQRMRAGSLVGCIST